MDKYKCEFCGKIFLKQSNLNTHVKTARYCLKLRNDDITNPLLCEFCNKEFFLKSSWLSHLKICRTKKALENKEVLDEFENLKKHQKLSNELELKYESDIIKLRSDGQNFEKIILDQSFVIQKCHQDYTFLLKKFQKENCDLVEKCKQEKYDLSEKFHQEIKLKDERIKELEKNIEFGKGVLVGYEKVKPPTVVTNHNTIVNQKLASVKKDKIRPATIETITEDINFYDFNMYLRREDGIVQFLTNMTQLKLEDGTIEQNYACTDKARSTFHRLLDSREWTLDGGAKLINEVFDILLPIADKHWKTLVGKTNTKDTFDREYYAKKITETTSFHHAFGRQTKDRKNSVNKIKCEIKHILSV